MDDKHDYNTILTLLRSNFVLSDLPVIIALVMLVSTPFFLLQNQQDTPNQIAGYAYYLLVVAILWKIIEHLINNLSGKKHISANKERTYA